MSQNNHAPKVERDTAGVPVTVRGQTKTMSPRDIAVMRLVTMLCILLSVALPLAATIVLGGW
jgi:hypothetical protein